MTACHVLKSSTHDSSACTLHCYIQPHTAWVNLYVRVNLYVPTAKQLTEMPLLQEL